MSPQKRGNKSPWAKRLAIVLACAAVVAGIGLFYQYFEGVNIPVTGLFMAEGPLKNLSQDTAKWTQGTFSNTMNVSVTNLTLKQFVNWTQFTPAASPSDRNSFAMAYENNAAIMVLFGGYGTGPLNDTRAYNFSTNNNWTDRNPSTAPSPRYGMKMVYDPLSGRIILFGGTNGTNVFSDTWAYNYSDNTWTLLSPAASPPALYHYSMAYHGSNQSIFLFGGTNGTNVFNELWAFNFTQNTWVNYTTFGVNWPSPRYGAALEYSTSSGTFILDGGYNGTDYLSDTREYYSNTNAWGAKAAGGAKAFHTMLFDQDQGLFLEFGGYTGASYLDSIRTYDVGGDTWSDVTYPAPPPVRANHSMAYYAAQKIFLMFGGNNATGNNGETWTYTPTGSPGYYLNGTYESSTFDAGSSVRWEKIFYNAMVPAGTALSFQLNYSVNGVTWNGWHGPLADPTAYYTSSGQAITSASSAPIQARYMRYKMYLTSNSTQASPVVSNVSFQINYSSALAIWDSMENLPIAQQLNYSRQPVFYANYTGAAGNPVTGATCLFSENSAGSWAADASMAYNASSGLYEYNKTVNPNNLNGAASFNVTCSKTGYASFSLIDQFTIPVFACDQGSLEGGDTCNITQFHYIRVVNYAINGTNLVVKNGAGITRTSGLVSDTTHTFNFSGNVTIENGGFVGEGSGGYLHSIRFFANNYNQAGTIRSSPGGNIDISAANASFSSTAVVSGSTGYIVNVSLAATSFSPGGSWTGASAYYFTLPNWQGNDTSVLYANNPSFNAVPWLEPDSLNCGPAQGSNAKIYGIQCNMAAATRTYEYLNVSGGATVYSAGALSLQVNQNASFYSSSFWHDSNPLGINSTNMAFSNFFFTGSQSIPAYGDVHLNASDTFSGSITAHSTNLLIRANSLNPDAIDTTKKNGAAAGGSGNVSLTAQTINAGTITTVNQYTVFSGYGLPGNVYINATGAVNVASIDARSRGNYGGTIDINAQQINGTTITASGITGPDNPGSGGSIRLNASGPVNVTTITAMGGNRSQFNSGGGNGGSIEINTSGTIKASLISARAGGRYQSSGGSVTLNANGAINVTTISTEDGQLSDFYGGSGGPVTINANGSVTATNIGTGTRTGTSANDGSYSGGPLTINANGSVTVTNIRTASEGGLYYTGQGGAVTINATGQVTVNSIAADGGAKNGAIPAFDGSNADVVTINAGGGVNVSTISSTGGAGYGFGGAGGNLTINANGTINAGTITTSGGSGASYGYGSGGTVRFNANGSVNATTITTAGSPGGPLKINATGNVTAASVNANGGNSNGAVDYLAGKGGDVNINAGSSLRLSQIDVSAGLYSYGTPLDVYGPDGGNVELIAPTITVTTLVRSNGGSAYHTGGGNPHGGSGGIITINSTQQTVVANITSSGGAAYGSTSGTYSFAHGGRGGNILMNSSQILVLGIIQSVGGYAQCTNGAGTSYGGGTGNITVIAQAINGTEIKSIGGDGVGAGGYAGYGGSGGAIRVAAQTINLTTITSTGAVGWNSGGTVASVCGSGGTVELTGQTAYLHQIKVCGASSTEWKVYGGNGGNVTVNLTGTMLIFETIDANGGQGGSTVTGGNAGKINALFSSLLYYGPVTALGGYSPSGSGTNGTINFTRTCRQCSGTYSPDPFFAWAPPTVAGFAKTATWSDIGGVHVNVSAYYWNDSWANNTITETGSADWTGGTYSNASVSINSGNINLSTGNTAGYYEHTIDAGEAVNWDLVKWWTTEPPGTNITMYTSSSNNSYKWTPLQSYSNSSSLAAYGGFYGDFAKAPVSRYLRYRAVFASNDSSKTPFLNEVYITWVNASAAPQLNGARSITLYNSTGDFYAQQSCAGGAQCVKKFDFISGKGGIYTVTATGINSSTKYDYAEKAGQDWFQEQLADGTLNAPATVDTPSVPYSVNITVSLNNSNKADMAYPDIGVSQIGLMESIVELGTTCGAILIQSGNCYSVFNVTLPAGLNPGQYYQVTWNGTWTNNDLSNTTITTSTQIGGAVTKHLSYNTSLDMNLYPGQSQTIAIGVTNDGNVVLGPVNNNFTATAINSSWISFSPSQWTSFTKIPNSGSTKTVTFSVSVPAQAAPGAYHGFLNTTGYYSGSQDVNQSLQVNVNVLTNASWVIVPSANQSNAFALNQKGIIANYTIENPGNIDLTFSVSYDAVPGYKNCTYIGTCGPNINIGGVNCNNNTVSVSKGSSVNICFGQSGQESSNASPGYGIRAHLQSGSADPTNRDVYVFFNVSNAPPQFINVSTITEGVRRSFVEFNKSVTLEVWATDDEINGLNASTAFFNVTAPGYSWSFAPPSDWEDPDIYCGGLCKDVRRFYVDFGNTNITGVYDYAVTFGVNDVTGQLNSTQFSFQVVPTTNINASGQAVSVANVTKSVGKNVSIPFLIVNGGNVKGYSVNVTGSFSGANTSGFSYTNLSYANLAPGWFSTFVNVSVPPRALGTYYFNPIVKWVNPNGVSGIYTASPVLISVLSNPNFTVTFPASLTIEHGHSTVQNLTVEATGNDNVPFAVSTTSISPNVTVSYSPSPRTVALDNPVNISTTVGVDYGVSSSGGVGGRSFSCSVQGTGYTKGFTANVVTPLNYSWSLSRDTMVINAVSNENKVNSDTVITHTGTADAFLNFQFGLFGNMTTFANLLDSSTSLSGGQSFAIRMNYTANETNAHYAGVLQVNESSGNKQVNISFNSFFYGILLESVSAPPQIIPGDSINATVRLADFWTPADITENVTYRVFVNDTEASQVNMTAAGSSKILSFTAPSKTDAQFYDFVVIGNYSSPNGPVIFTRRNASILYYKDITQPSVSVTTTDAQQGSNAVVSAAVSDNRQVSTVTAFVTWPDSTVTTHTMSLVSGNTVSGTWRVSSNFSILGGYTAVVSATDLDGNQRNVSAPFEVYYNIANFVGRIANSVGGGTVTNFTLLRPGTNVTVSNFSTNATGHYSVNVYNRTYDVVIKALNATLVLSGVSFSQMENLSIGIDSVPVYAALVPSMRKLFILALNFSYTDGRPAPSFSGTLALPFDVTQVDNIDNVFVARCADWGFTSLACPSGWISLTNVVGRQGGMPGSITVVITGFSAYAAGESVLGVAPGATYVTVYGGGGGAQPGYTAPPAMAVGAIGPSLEEIAKEVQKIISQAKGEILNSTNETLEAVLNLTGGMENKIGLDIYPQTIYLELLLGEETMVTLRVKNIQNASATTVAIQATGDTVPFFSVRPSVTLAPGETAEVMAAISIPEDTKPGMYYGQIIFTNELGLAVMPVTIRVGETKEKFIDLKLVPYQTDVSPGQSFKVDLNLFNTGATKSVSGIVRLYLINYDTDAVVFESGDPFEFESSQTITKSITVPPDLAVGTYMLKATAYYRLVLNTTRAISAFANIKVQIGLLEMRFMGVPLFYLLLAGAAVTAGTSYAYYDRYQKAKMKRYLSKIDFATLPQPGPDGGFLGLIAETNVRAFVDFQKLTMHTLVAGGSGSGKTVAAQVIAEEALKKGIAVVVFDPTAQWSGFLRPQKNREMLAAYKKFGMSLSEARAFDGNIVVVKNADQQVDLKKLTRPGEITVFVTSRLTPQQVDSFYANTVKQVFASQPEESPKLKVLFVYDEVHRLLPKFGGSGEGLVQIERAAREYRKWGLGLVLISQVLSDFVGEIKANISTEIQMRTKYEGDLERIRTKFGDETARSIVRSAIGSGMMHNPEYNRGAPYFVTYRALQHNIVRLSETELQKYDEYNQRIEVLEEKVAAIKAKGVDVLDLELELNIVRDKLKKGAFNIVDIYMESLTQKVETQAKKHGV